jgi:putative glutamine amidotransferase
LIPCDVKQVGIHPFHAAGEKYINAVAHGAGCMPLLLPAAGPGRDLRSLLEHVDFHALLGNFDGVFLSGSTSNVDPAIYGAELQFPVEHMDTQRDASTLALIHAAVDDGVPLLAVCRGFQEMNVAYGGTLHQQVHEQPDLLDHREDVSVSREQQYAPRHAVHLAPDGYLANLVGRASIEVNSLHGQGIETLGRGLAVEATAPDGLIEAIRVTDAASFALAIQWHAEWRFWEDDMSSALFSAFGDAARARAATRSGPRRQAMSRE